MKTSLFVFSSSYIKEIIKGIGLNIATRCDAISEECLDYLSELNKKTFLTVELGLQTIHRKTVEILIRLIYTYLVYLYLYISIKYKQSQMFV